MSDIYRERQQFCNTNKSGVAPGRGTIPARREIAVMLRKCPAWALYEALLNGTYTQNKKGKYFFQAHVERDLLSRPSTEYYGYRSA